MPFAQTIDAKELDCIASVADRWRHAVSLDRVAAGACGWCAPEILRKHGVEEVPVAARRRRRRRSRRREFRRAMDLARRQGALAWELRGAMSLARSWIGQGRFAEARELVAPCTAASTKAWRRPTCAPRAPSSPPRPYGASAGRFASDHGNSTQLHGHPRPDHRFCSPDAPWPPRRVDLASRSVEHEQAGMTVEVCQVDPIVAAAFRAIADG